MAIGEGFYLLRFDADNTLWALEYDPIWCNDPKKPWKLIGYLRDGGTVVEHYASREEAAQAMQKRGKVGV